MIWTYIAAVICGLMYTVFYLTISAIIWLPIVAYCICHTSDDTAMTTKDNILMTIVAIVMIIALIFSLGHGMYKGVPEMMIETAEWEEPYNYTTHQIVCLSDNNEITGSIRGGRYYVRGYIGETTTYHYYYQRYDGGYKLQKVSENNAVIYPIGADEQPRAEWYSQTRTFWGKSETKYFCKIYVPEGTIASTFEIDME